MIKHLSFVMYRSRSAMALFVGGAPSFTDKMARAAVKEGLREAESRPAGDGAGRGNEVTEMQKQRGEERGCVCMRVYTRTRRHVNLAPCLHSANLIHSSK